MPKAKKATPKATPATAMNNSFDKKEVLKALEMHLGLKHLRVHRKRPLCLY